VFGAFVLVILTCSLKLNAGSSVRPRIFGFLTVGITTSLLVRLNLTLCVRSKECRGGFRGTEY